MLDSDLIPVDLIWLDNVSRIIIDLWLSCRDCPKAEGRKQHQLRCSGCLCPFQFIQFFCDCRLSDCLHQGLVLYLRTLLTTTFAAL